MATRGTSQRPSLAAGSSVIQAGIVRRRPWSRTRNERRGFSLTATGRNRWPTRGWNGYRMMMIRSLVLWTTRLPEED
jgi:hypothetical protein